LIDKYKAHPVTKYFKQRENIYLFDTYSSVTGITSINILISLVVHNSINDATSLVLTFFNMFTNYPEAVADLLQNIRGSFKHLLLTMF